MNIVAQVFLLHALLFCRGHPARTCHEILPTPGHLHEWLLCVHQANFLLKCHANLCLLFLFFQPVIRSFKCVVLCSEFYVLCFEFEFCCPAFDSLLVVCCVTHSSTF